MSKDPNTGEIVEAKYSGQVLKEYSSNPLIEALPPIWSFEQVEELMHFYPEHTDEERYMEPHIRFHFVQRLFSYFQPWSTHFDIEQRISRVIRQGYISRNPLKQNYAGDLQKIYQMIKVGNYEFKNSELSRPSASGFTIIGFSGMGKSSAVENILNRYPQIILHEKYNDLEFDHKQIVWLKLDCPHDGGVKGLCADFFMEFDKLMGDCTYSKFAAGRNTTTATMIPRMAQIARRHSLGLLIIDEIQHLSVAKSGGQEKMLNFFVNLVNTIGIPVILIGTTKAMSVLQSEFRQARRGSGHQGDLVWENLEKDEIWDLLVEGMWRYQWTLYKCNLTKELKDTLHEESQGIVDIAVKLYAMVQMRAIATGEEAITPNLIRQVAKDNLKLVKPMLDALRSGNQQEINKYEDIRPLDLEQFCSKQLKELNLNMLIKQKQNKTVQLENEKDRIFEEVVLKLVDFNIEPDRAKNITRNVIKSFQGTQNADNIFKEAMLIILQQTADNKTVTRKVTAKSIKKDNDDLRVIIEKGRKDSKSAYEALDAEGIIIKPVEEFTLTG